MQYLGVRPGAGRPDFQSLLYSRHGNLAALEAVLKREKHWDEVIWSLYPRLYCAD